MNLELVGKEQVVMTQLITHRLHGKRYGNFGDKTQYKCRNDNMTYWYKEETR